LRLFFSYFKEEEKLFNLLIINQKILCEML
jgi:hypothetical protein